MAVGILSGESDVPLISPTFEHELYGSTHELFYPACVLCSNVTHPIHRFLNKYHIQGSANFLHGYVLLDSLLSPLAVMTFARHHKQSLKKTPEEKVSNKTERELRLDQGYLRVYDCGKIRWVLRATSRG